MLKQFDDDLRKKYGNIIVGIDECGRGAWADSMVAAGVCLQEDFYNPEIIDSKKLSEKQREKLYEIIINNSIAYSIQEVTAKFIDDNGLNLANIYVMEKVAEDLRSKINHIDLFVIDESPCKNIKPHLMFPKADSISMSVAAASILAKVFRDRKMKNLHEEYPNYNFNSNKGYIDSSHVEAVKNFGIIKGIHRESYKVKGFNKPTQLKIL